MSPTLVEALLLTLLSLAEQSHTFVTAVLSMMSRWSVGSLAPIYIHLLAATVWFLYLLTYTLTVSVFYAFLQSNMYLRQLKLLSLFSDQ